MFVATSLLQHQPNWRFYVDPKIHAVGLLVFSFGDFPTRWLLLGIPYVKFYESKTQYLGLNAQAKRTPLNQHEQQLNRCPITAFLGIWPFSMAAISILGINAELIAYRA